ncbi:hypothetical protein [Dactylosporangium sp. NPDC048998]|uniref:hypothetical protein n=1 Tax=Dactylosporangium sp. NPDC048998 TaxID=3363976 RepID=UPI00371189D2
MRTSRLAAWAGWRADLRRLWVAYAVGEFGSAVGAGALPLLAVLVPHVSDLRVPLLAAASGVASAVAAVPLAPWIEHRRKRPVMIAADLVRFGALGSVPVAAVFGVLSYWQLRAGPVDHRPHRGG